MQINSRLLDDIARVANGALGVAAGVRGEVEALLRQRFERILTDMDLVSREEFEAVKAMAAKARAEQEALAKKVARLEAALKAVKGGRRTKAPAKSSGKRSAPGQAAPGKTTPRTSARKGTAP
ncbi:MAG: accessory factor UbiK family protein [Alphaproteobacteria bacterium]